MNIQEIKVMLITETKNQNNSIMMLLRNIISKYNVLEKQKGNKKIDVMEILKKVILCLIIIECKREKTRKYFDLFLSLL